MGLWVASLNKLAGLMELMFLVAKLLMEVSTVDDEDVMRDDTGLDVTLDDDVRDNNVDAARCCG